MKRTLTFSLSDVEYTTGRLKQYHLEQLQRHLQTDIADLRGMVESNPLPAVSILLTLLLDDARQPDGSVIIPENRQTWEEKREWVTRQIDLEDYDSIAAALFGGLSAKTQAQALEYKNTPKAMALESEAAPQA